MKYAEKTPGVELINAVLMPLQEYPVTFTKNGLDPTKKYEVSMYCYWNLSIANYHIFANLHVNGTQVSQNVIMPSTQGCTQPLEIKSVESPNQNGEIELRALFSKTNPNALPLRIDGIYYSIEEIS